MKAILLKSLLCWAGHVSWMGNHCLPRIVLSSKLCIGHHNRGAPKNQFKGCLKKSFSSCQIGHHWCSYLSWQLWGQAPHYQPCFHLFENICWATFRDKKHKRNCNIIPSNPDQTLSCGLCDCVYTGLSHECVCNQHRPALHLCFTKPSHDFQI